MSVFCLSSIVSHRFNASIVLSPNIAILLSFNYLLYSCNLFAGYSFASSWNPVEVETSRE